MLLHCPDGSKRYAGFRRVCSFALSVLLLSSISCGDHGYIYYYPVPDMTGSWVAVPATVYYDEIDIRIESQYNRDFYGRWKWSYQTIWPSENVLEGSVHSHLNWDNTLDVELVMTSSPYTCCSPLDGCYGFYEDYLHIYGAYNLVDTIYDDRVYINILCDPQYEEMTIYRLD